MRQKIIDFIDWTLRPSVTPLGYLVVLHSFIFGSSFLFFGWTKAVQSIILYQIGALIGVQLWGILVFLAAGGLLIGLARRNLPIVNVGSFAMFMLWLFAVIVYFMNGFWLQGILAGVTMLYYGYFNLAAFMGRLWDYTPVKD